MFPREQAASMRTRNRDGRVSYIPPSRTTVTIVTDSLAPGGVWEGFVTMSPAYRVYRLETDRAARVRLYVGSGFQTADVSRPAGTDPDDGSGVVLDYVTVDPGLLEPWLSPMVDGIASSSDIPVTVTNLGASGPVTVTFTFIPVEQ